MSIVELKENSDICCENCLVLTTLVSRSGRESVCGSDLEREGTLPSSNTVQSVLLSILRPLVESIIALYLEIRVKMPTMSILLLIIIAFFITK